MNRLELENSKKRAIHVGRGFQSSVWEVEWQGERAAVKDFGATPFWFKTLVAPFLVSREVRALRHLNGTRGVPRFFGKVDRLAFAIEFIEGKPLAQFHPGEVSAAQIEKIAAAIARIHEKGVAHGDLKRRSNLIIAPDGEVWILDFAAAIIARGPISKKLMRAVAEVDEKSLPRLKKLVAPELLTDEDKRKLENPTRLEKWARRLLGR